MPRWVHPEVIARAAPLSLVAAFGLLLVDFLSAVLFHTGGGRAMFAVEAASEGWIHHSLAFGTISGLVLAALAFGPAGVRLRHLGLDRRELRRWIATAAISWCAVQVASLGAVHVGLVPALFAAAPLPETAGILIAMLLHTGLVEEIVYRGILLPVVVRRFGVAIGLALAALAFAASHLGAVSRDGSGTIEALSSLSAHWFWGVIDGALYLRCASLLTLAALHAVRDAPTPFAISEGVYSAIFVGLYVGGAVYIWLRRWP